MVMTTRKWEIKEFDNDFIILPKDPLYCPFCHELMLLHDFIVQKSSQGWYHADIHLKCGTCGFYATFGVPISESEYHKLRNSKYHAKIIDKDIIYLYPDKELEERIRSWGYW